MFRPRVEKLMVAARDRTKIVDGVIKQVDLVRGLVGPDVPVRGVLCFIEADWPLVGGSFATRDVDVLWPEKLCTPGSRSKDRWPRPMSRDCTQLLARELRPA